MNTTDETLRAVEGKLTAGKWVASDYLDNGRYGLGTDGLLVVGHTGAFRREDAIGLAFLRNIFPELIRLIEAARERQATRPAHTDECDRQRSYPGACICGYYRLAQALATLDARVGEQSR